MAARPTLALLIPAYNAAAFLPRLLKSASAQTPAFAEILVHDDCSTDGTAEVALALGARVVRSSANIGCTAGKARLLSETAAEWVHFHDADDELLPGFTSAAVEAISTSPFADVIITGTEERDESDPSHLAVGLPDPAALAYSPFLFSIQNKVNAISGVYNRAFLINSGALGIPEDEKYNEDQAIQLNLILAGARFECISAVLTRSYRHPSSMSQSNQLKCLTSHYRLMVRALGSLPNGEVAIPSKAAISARLWAVAAGAAASRDYSLANKAAQLARRTSRIPVTAGGRVFRFIASLHPTFALQLREESIRLLKPHLR